MATTTARGANAPSEKFVKSTEIKALLAGLRAAADQSGIRLDFDYRGRLAVEDLGLDIYIKNADCSGSCSTNCSGCSACAGCSGCSTTNTSKMTFGDDVINPDPISRFMSDLRDPAVQAMFERAAAVGRTSGK